VRPALRKKYYKVAEELLELATRILQHANKHPGKDYTPKIREEVEDVRKYLRKLDKYL